jgi:simple sugar transport system permease protein
MWKDCWPEQRQQSPLFKRPKFGYTQAGRWRVPDFTDEIELVAVASRARRAGKEFAMAEEVVSRTSTSQTNPDVAPERRTFWSKAINIFVRQREASIALVAIALCIYFWVANPVFLSQENIAVLGQYMAPAAIIAAGEVMLLICGEIDLSVGNVFALAPFLMFRAFDSFGIPLLVSIILALLASAAIGLLNGIVTVYFGVPSLIATLGTFFMLSGLTLIISDGFPQLTPDSGTAFTEVMGHGTYSEILWALVILIIVQTVLSRTRWGLHTVATGGNALGASEVGVNIRRIKIGNFILTSVLGGFAGILESFRITSIDPKAGGTDIMFSAVAGAVIGGTALQGGLGTVIGAFLGVFVTSILHDGFTILGVNAFDFDLILGAAILIAMILNVRLQKLREAGQQ